MSTITKVQMNAVKDSDSKQQSPVHSSAKNVRNEYATTAPLSNGLTLCIEIGSTRIKACFLQEITSIQQLQKVHTYTTDSLPYLNGEQLPLLFKNNTTNPILSHLEKAPYSGIAVSITGPVFADGLYYDDSGSRNLPKNLPQVCAEQAGCEFTMRNDVYCWAKGALAYQKLKNQEVKFPCLAITLGTAAGVVLCQDEKTLTAIELFYILDECPFNRLKEHAKAQPFPYWSPNRVLGKPFFDWVFANQSFQDEEMDQHLDEYNRRFQIFTEEITEFVQKKFGVDPVSMMIGGGNSRFVRIPSEFSKQVALLNPESMEAEGISPDIIQLLGAKNAMMDHSFPYATPSYQEMVDKLNAFNEGTYP